jgi:hypothetical protein
VLLRVLLVVQQLLQQNKHCSKRDVFYMYPSFFVGVCLSTAVVDHLRTELKVSYVLLLVLRHVYLCLLQNKPLLTVPSMISAYSSSAAGTI